LYHDEQIPSQADPAMTIPEERIKRLLAETGFQGKMEKEVFA
jgi:hypothetical protein